ncbi:hypothetical protein P3T76_015446 [Phytophthora citrophthora]|uniref:Uncharacterized protein n=1 Tax=Phytophthora citrophthora TaxID=4793 RepID=A0AAD9FZI4_9STRA|nr:hypothetical protein P3T76_015446 [Phytophthora citrophthora]
MSEQLREQQEVMKEQKRYTAELEEALETAASFAEQQNECNHQLNAQLAELENSQREQTDLIKTLREEKATVSSRLVSLVQQYTSPLRPTAATDRSVQDYVNLLDVEVQNGDVLRLLQLFPVLLEEYIATSTERNLRIDSGDPHSRYSSPVKSKRCRHLLVTSETTDSFVSKTPVLTAVAPRMAQFSLAVDEEDVQLEEQLELIRGAFQSYKEGAYRNK